VQRRICARAQEAPAPTAGDRRVGISSIAFQQSHIGSGNEDNAVQWLCIDSIS
jgi:hypothetical protein